MVYVFLADGFEEAEALVTVDILRRADICVQTVGIGGTQITGAHHITVQADISEEQAVADAPEAVVLPGGGMGTQHLEASACVQAFVDFAAEKGLLIGAICAAPSILGHKGLLRGKRATCFPSFEETLEGAATCTDVVVRDGNIVTGKGAGAVIPFALALVAYLTSPQKAKEIEASLQCT